MTLRYTVSFTEEVTFRRTTCSSEYLGSDLLCKLDGCLAKAACGRMDENSLIAFSTYEG